MSNEADKVFINRKLKRRIKALAKKSYTKQRAKNKKAKRDIQNNSRKANR